MSLIRESYYSPKYIKIYNIWLNNSINSNDSRSNVVSISKHFFLQQYKFVADQNFMEKEKSIKNGTKKILYTGRKIYTASLRALHETGNVTRLEGISLTVFSS